MVIKQLESILDESEFQRVGQKLIEQAIELALLNQLEWKRVDQHTLAATAELGEPPLPTPVIFHSGGGEEGVCYYLHLGDKSGPCKNSADPRVGKIADMTFGQQKPKSQAA